MEQINNFRKSLQFTLKWEGGYSYDASDPGGETKWGISKRYHPDVDIKNLTAEQAADIYAKEYWDACGCDDIPFPMCTVVFDTAVQPGIGHALDWLRASPDVDSFLFKRKMWYIQQVKQNPAKQKYLAGWLNRTADLVKFVQCNSQSDSSS